MLPVDRRRPRLERVISLTHRHADREAIAGDLTPAVLLRHLYGEELPVAWLDEAPGVTYPHLIDAAHRALEAEGLTERIRTVVLAVATPDSQHERLLGGYTNHRFASRPNAFAVAEQGAAGPFTAIAIAAHALAEPTAAPDDRALVLVLEQTTLPPAEGPRPVDDVAVALVLGRGEVGRPIEAVDVRRGFGPLRTGDAPIVIGGLGAEPAPATTADAAPAELVRPERPSVAAGVWTALARVSQRADAPAAAIEVHETDHRLGYRCALRLGAAASVGDGEVGRLALEGSVIA